MNVVGNSQKVVVAISRYLIDDEGEPLVILSEQSLPLENNFVYKIYCL